MAETETMRVRAIAPWFGGKRRMAKRIVEELGPHGQYFEGGCGSLAVLLAKNPCQKETVCDLHRDLINLARVVADPVAGPQLHERLARAMFSEAMLDEADGRLEAAPPAVEGTPGERQIERAYWYFLASWVSRNGTAGTEWERYQIAVRWTHGGGSPTVRFRNAVASLPAWHRRLQNVVILRRDLFDVVERFEDHEATAIYIDPTYPPETRTGFKSSRGGRYRHEFDHGEPEDADADGGLFAGDGKRKRDDHERLRDALAAYRRARVVVSYYDCPRVRRLYDGWTIVDCRTRKNLAATARGGRQIKDAPEILIVNGPSRTAGWPTG